MAKHGGLGAASASRSGGGAGRRQLAAAGRRIAGLAAAGRRIPGLAAGGPGGGQGLAASTKGGRSGAGLAASSAGRERRQNVLHLFGIFFWSKVAKQTNRRSKGLVKFRNWHNDARKCRQKIANDFYWGKEQILMRFHDI